MAANEALAVTTLSNLCSLYVPLAAPWGRLEGPPGGGWGAAAGVVPYRPVSFPYLDARYLEEYHSSAILAAAIDTVTLPLRLIGGLVNVSFGTWGPHAPGGAHLTPQRDTRSSDRHPDAATAAHWWVSRCQCWRRAGSQIFAGSLGTAQYVG